MRLTIIRDDSLVGVDGVFRQVDLSALFEGVRAVQWDGESGHVEHDDTANSPLADIAAFQSFIDLWTAAEPVVAPPTAAEMIASAHSRISNAYEAAVAEITAGYPDKEIASWAKQEREARAWLLDANALTPWIDGAAAARGITKAELVDKIIVEADALAPIHGGLTGKRQKLRDQIDALGTPPTQQQLDAIQW